MASFFSEDIRNALLAANEGGNPSLEQVRAIMLQYPSMGTVVAGAYKAGYVAALTTVAIAFGLSPQIIEAISLQIDIYDEHGTFLASGAPTGLGT